MASSFEKSVKGGTKIKLAAPKSKYVEHILVATHTGEAGVAEIFRALQNRLRDSTWTIVFKGLIIVHLMIREGEPDVTLRYVAANPRKLAISNFTDVQVQGRNIRHYTQFLLERARAYRETKLDYVRSGEGRLKKLSVEKGLLRETETVQQQIGALVKCDVLADEPENEITLTAFRLLVMDLLALFYVMNEGVINILEHFFEMSRYDAERALSIYKTFSKQTNQVVEYLSVARLFEHATRLEVPNLKHAPTSLTGSLEEYTQDPDFEINRRQYLAQLEAKKSRPNGGGSTKPPTTEKPKPNQVDNGGGERFPSPKLASAPPVKEEAKGPAPDLIDFFESIEQNQQPMAQSLSHQPTITSQPQPSYELQTQPLQPDPPQAIGAQQFLFGPHPAGLTYQQASAILSDPTSLAQMQNLSQNPTGTATSFGTFPSSSEPAFPNMPVAYPSMPQDTSAQFNQKPQQSNLLVQPQQSTNPFRQSMMAADNSAGLTPLFGGNPTTLSAVGHQSSNPFAKPPQAQTLEPLQSGDISVNALSPAHTASSQQYQQPFTVPPPNVSTSTNPFLQRPTNLEQQHNSTAGSLTSQPTGSTNPFRKSMFPNSQSGAGWQQGQQGTMGGLEQLPTVPVFPRPSEQMP